MENQKTNKQTKTHKNPKNLADRDLLLSKIYFSSAKDCCFLENIHNQEKQAAQTQSTKLTWATGLHTCMQAYRYLNTAHYANWQRLRQAMFTKRQIL